MEFVVMVMVEFTDILMENNYCLRNCVCLRQDILEKSLVVNQ